MFWIHLLLVSASILTTRVGSFRDTTQSPSFLQLNRLAVSPRITGTAYPDSARKTCNGWVLSVLVQTRICTRGE